LFSGPDAIRVEPKVDYLILNLLIKFKSALLYPMSDYSGKSRDRKSESRRRNHSSSITTVAVVGGGIAGMAVAARLANAGCKVVLFEANAELGGKLSERRSRGFRFDCGPSLFTLPETLEALFRDCGKDLKYYMEYDRLDLITRYHYANNTWVDAWVDQEKLSQELYDKFNEDPSRVLRYLRRVKWLYEFTAPVFLEKSLHRRSELWTAANLLKVFALPFIGAFQSLYRFNKSHFNKERTAQIFSRVATYNGSNPYKAPGTLALINHVEYGIGAYYPRGGMIAIRDALAALLNDLGVEVRLNTKVDKFHVFRNKILGVKVKDQRIAFDRVVSALDIAYAKEYLFSRDLMESKMRFKNLGMSAMVFHWGIRGNFPQLDLHNVFFSKKYRKEFDGIVSKQPFHDMTLYVYVSSKRRPEDAPDGHENWFVMVNMPCDQMQDWDKILDFTRKSVVQRLSSDLGYDIQSLIVDENVMTPLHFEKATRTYAGALYGQHSNSVFSAFRRYPNKHPLIRGLYFCGGSVHPGGGIPICLHSANIASRWLLDGLRQSRRQSHKHSRRSSVDGD
jgi:phytoene desaturase